MSRPAPVVSVAALLIAAVVALVPVQDAGALTVTEEEFLCPIDYSVSERIIVKSCTVFDRRLDFRPVGALISPPPIPVCDSNGFVLYQDEFTEAELTALRDLVTSEEFRHVREENGDWYVAGWLAERMGKPKSRTHYMYLYAAWAEEGGGDRLRMERALGAAFERFVIAERVAAEGSDDWWIARLMQIEIDRRFGRFERAAALLDHAASLDGIPEGYGHVLDRQRALIAAGDRSVQ